MKEIKEIKELATWRVEVGVPIIIIMIGALLR